MSGWVLGIALATFIVSVVASYMAFFSFAEGRTGALSTSAPDEPLGFLRVLDPNESIVTHIDSAEGLDQSVLDEPGLQILLDHMLGDSRMVIALPLSAYLLDWRSTSSVDPDARAVMGAAPSFVTEAPQQGEVLVWGSIEDENGAPNDVNDGTIHGHQVRQVSKHPLDTWFVAGNGHRLETRTAALAVFDVPTGRSLGVSHPYSVSEVLRGFTCSCQTDELIQLAEAMSLAEAEAGTGRIYYAVDYKGLVGPVQRSLALSGALSTGHSIGTLLGVWCLVVMVAQIFWTRRALVYRVERISGSSEIAIHIRSQMLIGLALTFPALAGFTLVSATLRGSAWPPPLPAPATAAAIAGILLMHTLAGGINAVRVHRLCSLGREEVRNV